MSLHSNSLFFQTLSISSVDFVLLQKLNSGCCFVLNENRGQCRVLSSRQGFFFSLCLLDYFDVKKKGHITNLVMFCALCDPGLNQALFNNGRLR